MIRRRGHVLISHGGGCAPYTQVNDTHLHATLAKMLIELENEWALKELERFKHMGASRTPQLSREGIISLLQAAWASADHGRVAKRG